LVCVTVSFQFQFQQRDVPYGDLTARMTAGPWKGIKVTAERAALVDSIRRDLAAYGDSGDSLLVLYGGPGYYLMWDGPIASDTYWHATDPEGDLPPTTVEWFRRRGAVPGLVLRLIQTAGLSDEELASATGGLDYRPALVRPGYFFALRPPGETTGDVLDRLPSE
jgi:hypothetical protein